MKTRFIIIVAMLMGIFTACEVDNYDAPNTVLEGKLLYQGKEVATKKAQMKIELYEKGWDFEKEIGANVDQNGHYSVILFDGSYKLFLKDNRGSFMNFSETDTINVDLKGNKQLDIAVTPFFFVNEPNYSVSGNTLTASFSVDKVVAEKTVKHIKLLVGKTLLVDEQYKAIEEVATDISNLSSVSISTDISELKAKGYCFARIAVGTEGVNTYNYSFSKKIEL